MTNGYNTAGLTKDGFDTDYSNPITYGIYLATGGEKDDAWLAKQQNEKDDDGWNALFAKK